MDEITAEYSTEQIAPQIELRVRPRVTVGAKTDLGRVRENNEDKFEFYMTEDPGQLAARGLVFLVCDGMGGHAAGQIASELAAKTFIDTYLSHPSAEAQTAILSGVNAANRFVLDNSRAFPARRGMGTTLSGLMLVQDQGYVVQVGDSRVYRVRDGVIECITTDHTWVEEAIKAGMITPEEAEVHPYKHVLTRAIGTEGDVRPDLFPIDVQVGDLYILCSDGVMNHVTDEGIGETVTGRSPADAAWRLVKRAVDAGGSDNTTVLAVRVDALEPVG